MRPLLLIGGPLELDDTEIPDTQGSVVKILNAKDGTEHLYYVLRDWELDRWVGKYQRPVKEIAR
jgi:transcription elongation GreA/GreB family factor